MNKFEKALKEVIEAKKAHILAPSVDKMNALMRLFYQLIVKYENKHGRTIDRLGNIVVEPGGEGSENMPDEMLTWTCVKDGLTIKKYESITEAITDCKLNSFELHNAETGEHIDIDAWIADFAVYKSASGYYEFHPMWFDDEEFKKV